MSGEFPFGTKIVSPIKCNEKPWDLWVSEIGHLSPLHDDEDTPFTSQATADKASASARRVHDAHPYKSSDKGTKYRRAGVNRLKLESMSLHGLFPQMDNLNAAVCHMCGVIVKCSGAYRHLLESHNGAEPIRPPPPPTVKLKSAPGRSRHKKEALPPPVPLDLPVKMETSPVHTATAPISRIVLPQPDMQYMEEPGASSAISGESGLQVCVESGELPVVSIQDPEDLPLGENLTDEILTIMNSEGIQSADDDITNTLDWKNIILDIGKMQEMNFPSTSDPVPSQDLYTPVDKSLAGYTMAESVSSNIQFAPNRSPMLSSVIDNNVLTDQALKSTPSTPSTKTQSRKSSNTKTTIKYDPNKHCGVMTGIIPAHCMRSLTCKNHSKSLKRTVEGRSKPYDTLYAEHKAASKDAASAGSSSASLPTLHHTPAQTPAVPLNIPPLLVNSTLGLSSFNGLTAEQQVNDIYASLLSVEDPVLPDTSSITSLLSQPLPSDPFLLPDDAEIPTEVPRLSIAPAHPTPPAREDKPDLPPPLVPSDVCWYSACPRPLALCTFNASHAGGAITLGKKFATVRSNIKSSLSRSCKATGAANNFYNQSVSLSKTMHINNASKTNKPEVRKLIVTCSNSGGKEVQQTLNELFGGEVRHALNGHLGHGERKARPGSLKGKRPSAGVLDLGFSLDPLLADEKC